MKEYGPINTQQKDRDPRKRAFAIGLIYRHKKAVKIWQRFNLMVKIPVAGEKSAQKDLTWGHSVRKIKEGWERRKHFAPEHMVTVVAGVRALCQLLQDKGFLSKREIFTVERAAVVHDAGKELEFVFVNTVLRDPMTVESTYKLLGELSVNVNNKRKLEEKIRKYISQLSLDMSKGVRGQAAYDLAGDINELRLKENGVSDKVIKLQKMVGHTSCPETERIVDLFNILGEGDRKRALQILVLHYLDDIVTNPNIIDTSITKSIHDEKLNALDRRCIQNENNEKYNEYNQVWKDDLRNNTSETAFGMQRRVGHKIEKLLADLLGITDPLNLPGIIEKKIRSNIQDNWNKLQQPKSNS